MKRYLAVRCAGLGLAAGLLCSGCGFLGALAFGPESGADEPASEAGSESEGGSVSDGVEQFDEAFQATKSVLKRSERQTGVEASSSSTESASSESIEPTIVECTEGGDVTVSGRHVVGGRDSERVLFEANFEACRTRGVEIDGSLTYRLKREYAAEGEGPSARRVGLEGTLDYAGDVRGECDYDAQWRERRSSANEGFELQWLDGAMCNYGTSQLENVVRWDAAPPEAPDPRAEDDGDSSSPDGQRPGDERFVRSFGATGTLLRDGFERIREEYGEPNEDVSVDAFTLDDYGDATFSGRIEVRRPESNRLVRRYVVGVEMQQTSCRGVVMDGDMTYVRTVTAKREAGEWRSSPHIKAKRKGYVTYFAEPNESTCRYDMTLKTTGKNRSLEVSGSACGRDGDEIERMLTGG